MPNLDHTGPNRKGPKTGRKQGKCHKTEEELKSTEEIDKGQGKRPISDDKEGIGKRLKKLV